MARFRACWVTQAESGWAVTPATYTHRVDDLLVSLAGVGIPLPGVRERLHLGRGLLTVLLEQQVVGGVGVERRVQVDEIDALVLHVPAEHVEVVALVEEVRLHGRSVRAAAHDLGVRRQPQSRNLAVRQR
jgi:hypothetical protein